MKHFQISIIKASIIITTIVCLTFAYLISLNIEKIAEKSVIQFSEKHIEELVANKARSMQSYVQFNQKYLEDIASNPYVAQTCMQPEDLDTIIDYFKNLKLLGVKRSLTLYDFEGTLIYTTQALNKRSQSVTDALNRILEDKSSEETIPCLNNQDEVILHLMVPVKFAGQVEGVLTTIIHPKELWATVQDQNSNYYTLSKNDKVISQSKADIPNWLPNSPSSETLLWPSFSLKGYLFKDSQINTNTQLFADLTKQTLVLLLVFLFIVLLLTKAFFVNQFRFFGRKLKLRLRAKMTPNILQQ